MQELHVPEDAVSGMFGKHGIKVSEIRYYNFIFSILLIDIFLMYVYVKVFSRNIYFNFWFLI